MTAGRATAHGRRFRGAMLAWALALVPALAQEAELVAEQPSGLVPMDGESAVTIRGFTGKIEVWGGSADGVQFDATDQASKAPVPIRISSLNGRLILEPPPGAPARKWSLQITAPPRIGVKIEAADSQVLLTRSDAACEISGKDLAVDLSYLDGPVSLDLQGGTLRAMETAGDILLRGKGWNAKVGPSRGRLGLYGGPGAAEVEALEGRLDADVEQVRLRLAGVNGEMSVRARGGAVDVLEAKSGGDFTLFGAPVTFALSGGRFDVASDAAIRFRELRADLRVEGDGASVEGTGNTERVEVRTHDANVILNQIGGPVRVSGAGLTVQMKVVSGEVQIDSRTSTIDLTSIAARLQLTNDGGDIRLTSVYGDTTLNSHGGSVRVTDQGAALELFSDGADTSVEWSILPPGSKSVIENENGPVSVRLPTSGNGCRIEARTSFGRVESPFKRVVVAGDGTDAQGYIGSDTSTVVRVKAAGDIRLSGGLPDTGERP